MSLPTRKIGNHNVSEIGFGAMGLSAFYGELPPDEERMKLLDTVFELGCTFWDTADVYGDSEDLLGRWFKRTGKRDQIFLATKFGFTWEGPNTTPEYMRTQIEKSLSRLGTDRIDLYYLHRVNKDLPIEVTIRAMAELVKERKVTYLGLSEVSADTLRRAHAIHPISAVQVEYSPFALEIEQIGLLKACRELGVTVVCYAPLGRGMLTGAYKSHDDLPKDDVRKIIPKYSEENFPKLMELVEGLQNVGKKHNATSGQVALAWLLAQGDDIIPIPGTKKIKYLEENVGAMNVKLSDDEVAYVRQLVERANIAHLDRYPTDYMVGLYGDTVKEN